MTFLSRSRTAAALAAAGVAATCLVAAGQASAATSEVTLRQGDLDTSETRTAGHVGFLPDGLAVWTDDAGSQAKAAGYFPLSGALPSSASLVWYGTQPQPGQQIVFDADGISGNGNDYNILVGEPVYGADWWLTGSSSAAAKAADPSGTDNGGSGSEWFGTLAQWKQALPTARVLAGGFSLGSGVQGSGVISSITYGDTAYRFTSAPAASGPIVAGPRVVDAQGFVKAVKVTTRRGVLVRVALVSDKQPDGTDLGSRLGWRIAVDGATVFSTHQQFDDRDDWTGRFAKGSRHVVKVFKNGHLARKVVVRPAG